MSLILKIIVLVLSIYIVLISLQIRFNNPELTETQILLRTFDTIKSEINHVF